MNVLTKTQLIHNAFFEQQKISRFGFRANNGTAESVERNELQIKRKTLNNYTSEPKDKIEFLLRRKTVLFIWLLQITGL